MITMVARIADLWRSELRALVAAVYSALIARRHVAPGSPARPQDVPVTETPTTPTDGNPEVRPAIMANDAIAALTRRNLDEAISQYIKANFGASQLLTDWALVAETVEPNLNAETDEHALWLATSEGLSSWRLFGLSAAMSRLSYATLAS